LNAERIAQRVGGSNQARRPAQFLGALLRRGRRLLRVRRSDAG
jgi:hypothetical protein